jgi:O-antigen/teichoic acid export membrane protein
MPHHPDNTVSGKTSSRLAWVVADQILSSGTNFALGILIARSVSVSSFGIFTLAFAAYQIFCGVARGLVSEPFVVRFTRSDLFTEKRPIRHATGASLLIGTTVGAGMCLVAFLLNGETRDSFFVLGIAMPALLLQDSWRFVFFAAGRPTYATLNDGVWTIFQLALVILLIQSGHYGVALLLGAWCFSAAMAAVFGLVQARVIPYPHMGFRWIISTRDLSARFFAEFAIGNGSSQIMLWLVGLTAGVLAAGSLRAAQLLLGPPRIIVTAYSAIIPEGVRFRKRHPSLFPSAVIALAVVLGGANLLWGGVFLVLPTRVGEALLGKSWASARPLILILAVGAAAFGVQTAAIAALRVLAAANRSLKARVIAAPISLVAVIVGGAIAGAKGAALGITAGPLLSAPITWAQWRAARREPDKATATANIGQTDEH